MPNILKNVVGLYTRQHMTAMNYSDWCLSDRWVFTKVGCSGSAWQQGRRRFCCLRADGSKGLFFSIYRPVFYHQFSHSSLLLPYTTRQFQAVAQSKVKQTRWLKTHSWGWMAGQIPDSYSWYELTAEYSVVHSEKIQWHSGQISLLSLADLL